MAMAADAECFFTLRLRHAPDPVVPTSTGRAMDAITLLKDDHKKVKALLT